MGEVDKADKKRTRVACETCRRKKIKCSGEYPCANCVQLKEPECKYIEKLKSKRIRSAGSHKQKVSKRVSNAKAVEIMDTRLRRIENFITNISKKLDCLDPVAPKSPQYETASETEDEVDEEDEEEDEEEEEDREDDTEDYVKREGSAAPDVHAEPHLRGLQNPMLQESDQELFAYSLREQFFESHSFLSVFSQKSMDWISKCLEPDKKKVMAMFYKLPYVYYNTSRAIIRKWVDPVLVTAENKKRLLERPIIEDREFVLALLESSHVGLQYFKLFIDYERCRQLLEDYFNHKKLTNSQYLIICSTFHFMLSARLDKSLEGFRKSNKILERYTEKQLQVYQGNVLDSGIVFYHRICVIGQGIDTIRAILMFAVAVSNVGIPDIDYMLLSVAMRYAQEMGLHRPESYLRLDKDEIAARKGIWFLCQQLDIEFSFRNGKPPVISSLDSARTTLSDVKFILLRLDLDETSYGQDSIFYNPGLQAYQLNHQIIVNCYGEKKLDFIFLYCSYLLNRLRLKSYFKLFLTVGDLQTVENLEAILTELNNDALYISSLMVNEFKPRFYDDPQFADFSSIPDIETRDEITRVQFTFFFHLLLTNRVPFMTKISADRENIAAFRRLHVRSARTLLHLSLIIDFRGKQDFILSWIVFYPFAAFLMLLSNCMNNPTHPESALDVKLLCDVSTKLFKETNFPKDADTFNYSKLRFCMVVMKIFVEVTKEVLEKQGQVGLEISSEHKKQVRGLLKIAPELFSDKVKCLDITIKSSFDERELLSNSNASSHKSFNNSPINTQFPNQHIMVPNMNGIGYQSDSPSYNPALANIIDQTEDNRADQHPYQGLVPPDRSSSSTTNGSPGLINLAMNDESFTDLLNVQINQLPNFFFDNNLGF